MKKLMILLLFGLFYAQAFAGCDPCKCGNGGDNPPPTGCTYGPWAVTKPKPKLALDLFTCPLNAGAEDCQGQKEGAKCVTYSLHGGKYDGTCVYLSENHYCGCRIDLVNEKMDGMGPMTEEYCQKLDEWYGPHCKFGSYYRPVKQYQCGCIRVGDNYF